MTRQGDQQGPTNQADQSEATPQGPITEAQSTEAQLSSLLWAVAPVQSVAPTLVADIALSAALNNAPEAPFSLAAGLSQQISGRQMVARATATDKAPTEDALTQWLRTLPAPELPRSQAGSLAWAIAQQAQQGPSPQGPLLSPAVPVTSGAMLRWLGVVNTALAVGGLVSVSRLASVGANQVGVAGQSLGLMGVPPTGVQHLLQQSLGLFTPATITGLILLIATSAALIWRPQLGRRGVWLLLPGIALTLPTLWQVGPPLGHSLGLGLGRVAAWGPMLVAALLLQVALLLLSGRAQKLVSQQLHFPVQALAVGALSTLGLTGLGLILLTLGLLWTVPVLGVMLLLLTLVGLGVSVLSLGRAVFPAFWSAPARWVGSLTGLGLYMALALALPPVGAWLLIMGGAWGLGSLMLPRSPQASSLTARPNS